jgi:hypothetical protein
MAKVEIAPATYPWPGPSGLFLAWMTAWQTGAELWTNTWVDFTRQAMNRPALLDGEQLVRDELLLLGEQAQRTAEAARETLDDLGLAAAGGGAVIPSFPE